jgi:RNA polymerase sigma-70 factor (ECF subfamily)
MHTATAACSPPLAPAFEPAAATLSWADVLPYRGDLLRYARRKLMDPSLAEDLVHDVFEAVATGRAAFGGRSALRTWLVGILKHKIVDLVRERAVHEPLADADDAGLAGGAGLVSPQPGPDEQVACRQRLAQAMARLETLTPGVRQAFELRVLQERSTAEVCSALAITEDNLFVRLHRARRALAA